MRKFFTTLKSVVAATLIAAMALSSCSPYDDSGLVNEMEQIKDKLEALTNRVAALETKLQSEVDAVKALINEQVVITGVEKDADGNQTITLSNGETITVLAPVGCTCEPSEPCTCDPLQYRVVDGVLEVSADGNDWVAINGVTAECVVASIVVNEDGTATVTLADGTSFTTAVAELVEFEAAKSSLYVKFAETVAIPFAINDAVQDINVMNTPLGWKAEIVDTRAVGGMDYVLNITGPAKNFAEYAEKSGKVAIHFNTAAGACKVMSVDVELAAIDLQVDKAGNITIVNTLVDKYDRENWGVTEHVEEFNNYYFAVVGIEDYEACGGDLESVFNSNWGEFNIPAAASFIQNFFTNVGENGYENAIYQDGVNEKWTVNFTVAEAIDYLDWYGQMTYEGNSFMVCVIPTDVKNAGNLIWEEMVAVPFKQLALSIVENVDARAFNNAYFDVTLRGGVAYHLYPMSMKDVNDYVEVYQYYPSMEDLFWDYLNSYLQYPNWYSFGFEIAEDVVETNISLSDLLAYTYDYYSFETKPATDYVMALFTWEDGKTEYTKEDLKFFYFSTGELTAADPAFEATYELNDDHGLYTVAVDLSVPENVAALYTRWYDNEMGQSDLVEDLINNGYGRDAADLEANQYTVYVGTSVSDPGTTKYLGVLMIDADGNYTATQFPVKSAELVINETYTPTIESVTFDSEGAHILVGGIDGAEVKAYKYYIISTTGSSYYQKTEEQLFDVAYSNDWLYQSSETNPILATRTADYTYSFAAGATYKVAVGVQFADGSYSNCVYGEYVNDVPPTALTSVVASFVETDPNWCYLTLTAETGDVITTSAGNGGVNYLNEGVWDYQNYYSSGFALGNTYMNNTTWVDSIQITVAYTEAGQYNLKVVTSKGVFAYEGAIEGLIVPGFEGGDEPGEGEEPGDEELFLTFTSGAAEVYDSYNDFNVYLYGEGLEMCLNFFQCCTNNFIPEGQYAVGYISGACIFAPGYSWVKIDGVQTDLHGGFVTVAEVDGKYQFTLENMYYGITQELKIFNGTFCGDIEGLVVPSAWKAPEASGDTIELTPYDWFRSYGTWGVSNEFEIGWYDQDGYHISIDFLVNPIVEGTYTLENGLSGMYSKYRGIGMTNCTVNVTDAGDGQLAFDVTFLAQIEGVFNDYHFTWVGDPSAL